VQQIKSNVCTFFEIVYLGGTTDAVVLVLVLAMSAFLSKMGMHFGLSLENSLESYLILSLLMSKIKSNSFVPTAQGSSLIAFLSLSSCSNGVSSSFLKNIAESFISENASRMFSKSSAACIG